MQLVVADVLCSFVYGVLTVALLVVSARLGLDERGYGYLLAAVGGGAVLGAAVAGRASRTTRPRHVIAPALLFVALPLPLVTITPLLGALITAALSGAGAMVVEVLTETALQRSLDEAVFARAYGFAFPASIAGIAVGGAVAAPLIALFGLTAALAAVAAPVLAYAVWILRVDREHHN
jgi:predicted MFS family arabinose efflux permease